MSTHSHSRRPQPPWCSSPPAKFLDNSAFLSHCITRKHHRDNSLARWNYLYEFFNAEYCWMRRELFYRAHRRHISEVSSTDLCFSERYTACVNFTDNTRDGLVRHVCDMLPIVIGSNVDLKVRNKFWALDKPAILEDLPKIGFLIQNKNYYNFAACFTTNPKVCHVYRCNTKLPNAEVRLYYYDNNFCGNRLSLKQYLVFDRCDDCPAGKPCTMRYYVLETMVLRNSYKLDFVFMTRRCNNASQHQSVRDFICFLRDGKGSTSTYAEPVCADIFSPSNTAKQAKFQCNKNAVSFVLCDCNSSLIMEEWADRSQSCFVYDNIDKMRELNDVCFLDTAARNRSDSGLLEKTFTLFVYMHEVLIRNEDIDMMCNKCIFDGPILYHQLMLQLKSYLCDKYYLADLFTDSADALIAKMRVLSHTGNLAMLISRRTKIRVDLTNDIKRYLKTEVKREKMQNIDVCSNAKIFSSTLVVPATTSIAASSSTTINSETSSLSEITVTPNNCGGGNTTVNAVTDAYVSNMNTDFLLRCKRKQKRSVLFDVDLVDHLFGANNKDGGVDLLNSSYPAFYTGLDPRRRDRVIIVYSSFRDYNSGHLLNYGNLYFLQGISAPHYTDNEFVFEQVKRPRVTNQQNSLKCARMPRNFERFLSFYNIGNLSTAGRCMNLCVRTRISFFVQPLNQVAEWYFRWILHVYRDDSYFDLPHPRVSYLHCVAHATYRCPRCFLFLVINEMPFCDLLIDKFLEFPTFFLSKMFWPAVQFYRKANTILSVSILSGIVMLPVALITKPHYAVQQLRTLSPSHRWCWCDNCELYFPTNLVKYSSSLFVLDESLTYTYRTALVKMPSVLKTMVGRHDGLLSICKHHVWFSSNDLAYYKKCVSSSSSSSFPQTFVLPFYYEIACHGAFSCVRSIASVDISKIIVSINAGKRRLRLAGNQLADVESSVSPFESLMDQNARILVYTDRSGWRKSIPADDTEKDNDDEPTVLRDTVNEPLREIIAVPSRNSFYCCFAFGDFEGFNCEDAYVFNERYRPLVENVIELKVNYYKYDRSVIKTGTVQCIFRPNLSLNPGNGCTIYLGDIIAYHKLSFGSTMIGVKMIRHRNGMYRYSLYYVLHASYLRRDAPVFQGDLAFQPFNVKVDRFNDDHGRHTNKSSIMMLYDAVSRTGNGNIVVAVQMNTRQLRFRVSVKNVKTTQKIQNNCGQKGMPVYRDLSDLVTDRGGVVHIVVSSYSLLSRLPVSQLLEQRSGGGCDAQYSSPLRIFSRKTNKQVGWGGYGFFFFSCDSPHDNIIVSGPNVGNNPMRVCNMTYNAAIDSGLSTAISNRTSDHENYKNNPSNGMTWNVYKLFTVYRYLNRNLVFKDFITRRVREQLRDWLNLTAAGIECEPPDYLSPLIDQLCNRRKRNNNNNGGVVLENGGGVGFITKKRKTTKSIVSSLSSDTTN